MVRLYNYQGHTVNVTPKSVLIVSMVTCHQLIALSSASRKTLSTVLSPILLQKTLQITSYPQKAPQDFPISPVSSTISPSFNPMFYSYWTTHNSLTEFCAILPIPLHLCVWYFLHSDCFPCQISYVLRKLILIDVACGRLS